MAKFKIPENYFKGFSLYISLESEQKKIITNLIKKSSAGLFPQELAQKLSFEIKTLTHQELESIFSMIFSLFRAKEIGENKVDEFVTEIIQALNETNKPELKSSSDLNDNLIELLSIKDSINITTKAVDLTSERERLTLSTRILTDVRPVLNNDDEIQDSIIIHNLKIEFHQNRRREELYFALSDDDLKKLKEQIIRAEKKEESIKNTLSKSINFIKVN